MKDKKFWISLLAGILVVVMLLGLILNILPAFASEEKSSDEIKEQIAEMEKENEATQKEIDELKKQLKALKKDQANNLSEIQLLIQEKNLIDQQVGLLYTQVTGMNEQIAAYNVLIADKQEELEKAQLLLEELNLKSKERIRAMEEDGSISYWSVLFQARSFSDLLDRLNMVQEIAAADGRRLKQLRSAAESVEVARKALLEERAALEKAKEELSVTQSEMMLMSVEAEALLSQLTVKMEELKQQEGAYEQMMGKLEDDLAELEVAIGKAETDLDAALYREYMATMTTVTTYPTGANAKVGYIGEEKVDEQGITWLVPCDYLRVSSAYGWRTHPVYHDRRFHHGVDLAANCLMKKDGTTDSPIIATRAGVVTIARWSDSAGWYVKIDHLDGYASVYMHMCCRPDVKEGDIVTAGQYLGCIGTTGTSTGDHLHFGIYKNGTSVNPMDYIG